MKTPSSITKLFAGLILLIAFTIPAFAVPIITQSNNTGKCATPSGGGNIRWTNTLVNRLRDNFNPTPLTWTEEGGIGITMNYVDHTRQTGSTSLMDYTPNNTGGDPGVISMWQDAQI